MHSSLAGLDDINDSAEEQGTSGYRRPLGFILKSSMQIYDLQVPRIHTRPPPKTVNEISA